MKRFWIIISALTITASLFIFSGCALKPVGKPPIKISINVWSGYAYAFLAQEKGFFTKNGVQVEFVLKESTPESLELFVNGDVDGCFDILADIIMISAQGIPAKVVWVVDYSDTGDVVIGRPEITSLAELRGKTVSFEGVNTFSNIFVLNVLEKAGLEEGTVKFANIKAHEVLKALDEKRIDAGHTWEPTKSQALSKGYKILASAQDTPGIITDVLVFDPDVIKKRPDDIRAIVKSISEARDYFIKNPEESIRIMSHAMGMSEKEMAAGIDGIYTLDLRENMAFLTTTTTTTKPSLYTSVKTISDFYLRRGQLAKIIDIKDIVDPRFVKELSAK